ncbi:hypothetical protein BX600DRAFT_555160 [Xylariales sp. PMI_506]|nr:hypothetical protein BX600DRAFT_555160 [Xylariales sp. PMI_506]
MKVTAALGLCLFTIGVTCDSNQQSQRPLSPFEVSDFAAYCLEDGLSCTATAGGLPSVKQRSCYSDYYSWSVARNADNSLDLSLFSPYGKKVITGVYHIAANEIVDDSDVPDSEYGEVYVGTENFAVSAAYQ